MKTWVYCQSPEQLHSGAVRESWRAVAAGYLVQVLGAPDLYVEPDAEPAWRERVYAAARRTAEGARGLPWIAVTQAANRFSAGRGPRKILYDWGNQDLWAALCRRVQIWADAAKVAGAVGLCFDFEDYARRFGDADPGWAGMLLGGPGRTPAARAAQWLEAAWTASLPISVMGDALSCWDFPIWKSWVRTLTQGTHLYPQNTEFWTEDLFAAPNEEQFKGVRAGLVKRIKRERLGAGLTGDPTRAVNHPLATLAFRRGLPLWCYPWRTS